MEARKEWGFKVSKETKHSISRKAIFKNEDEIEIFSDQQKLKEFVASRRAMEEMGKGILWAEMKGH